SPHWGSAWAAVLQTITSDFMFQLSRQEFGDLKSQSVISSGAHGGSRTPPLVFSEQGVAMLSGVLRSERAITVNIQIMRVFVELRRAASSYVAIERRLEQIEGEIGARLASMTRNWIRSSRRCAS
ncbi:MAG TPA: ORF6N domain-containing protein, partial [Solirubrobacterales bacterium]|nr:ORF6N domain-containing protein [Solirubrobacterales bacterium]